MDDHGPDGPAEMTLARSSSTGSDERQFVQPQASRLPDQVARIWDRLELRDRSMISCLEAIVRAIRVDGTALVAEIVDRYVDTQLRAENSNASGTLVGGPLARAAALRAELIESVLPRLAASDVISYPDAGQESAGALIEIANPWLRLALLESGLIELSPSSVGHPAEARGRVVTGKSATAPHADGADDWSQIWFAVQRYSWTTLAIVPASPRERGLAAAAALVAAGSQYAEGSVHLVDATRVAPHAVDLVIASISGSIAPGTRLVVALDNPITNPSSIPIARHAGAALLTVRLGDPSVEEASRAIDVVGRRYFVGSVALRQLAG